MIASSSSTPSTSTCTLAGGSGAFGGPGSIGGAGGGGGGVNGGESCQPVALITSRASSTLITLSTGVERVAISAAILSGSGVPSPLSTCAATIAISGSSHASKADAGSTPCAISATALCTFRLTACASVRSSSGVGLSKSNS